MAAVHLSPQVDISTNSGLDWIEVDVPGATNLSTIAWSADGSTLVAPGNYIFTSTNLGTGWTKTASPYANWFSIACSADAAVMMAVGVDNGNRMVYSTTNAGASWTPDNLPGMPWATAAMSADGNVRVVGAADGGIYSSQVMPKPALRASASAAAITLSWAVPSMNFALQHASDLLSGKWTKVPITPVLDTSKLHYKVTVPKPAGQGFYRLALE